MKMKWRKGQSAVNNPRSNTKKVKVETALIGKPFVGTKAVDGPIKSSWAQRVREVQEVETVVSTEDMSTSGSKSGTDLPEAQPAPPLPEIARDDAAVESPRDDQAHVAAAVPMVEPETYAPAEFDPVQVCMAPPAVSMAEPARTPELEAETAMHFEPAPLVYKEPVAGLEPNLLALTAHAASYPGSLMSEDQYHAMSSSHTPAQSTHKEAAYYQPTPMVPPSTYQMVQFVHPSALAAVQERCAQLTEQLNAQRAAHEGIHREYQIELGKVKRETAQMALLHERAMKRCAEESAKLRHHVEENAKLRHHHMLIIADLRLQLEEARAMAARLVDRSTKAKATQVLA